MRISRRIILGCAIGIIGLISCILYGEASTGQVNRNPTAPNPIDLKVEYANRPLGIDELHPRFAWLPLLENQGIQQAAYQIWVATSLTRLLHLQLAVPGLWPAGNADTLRESGKALSSVKEVQLSGKENGNVVLKEGSGNYFLLQTDNKYVYLSLTCHTESGGSC